MTETVTVKAKAKFTTALASGLIVHMRPDMEKFATRADIPIADAVRMHKRKWIEDFEGLEEAGGTPTAHTASPAASARPVPAPSKPEPASPAPVEAPNPYTAKHVGGGHYEITGPGIGEPVKITGKAAAMEALEKLAAAHAASAESGPGGEPPAGEGAPAGDGLDGPDGNPDEPPVD